MHLCFLFLFFPYLLAVPCSMQDLSYPSSQTHAPYKGKRGGLIAGPPGLSFSSPHLFFYFILMIAHPTNIFFICLFFLLLLPPEWMQHDERDFNGIMLYPHRVEWHLAYCSFFINIHWIKWMNTLFHFLPLGNHLISVYKEPSHLFSWLDRVPYLDSLLFI